MICSSRSTLLLSAALLAALGPSALQARAAGDDLAGGAPGNSIGYVAWRDLPAALGLRSINAGSVRALAELFTGGELDEESAALVDVLLAAAGGRGLAALVPAEPTGNEPPFSILALSDAAASDETMRLLFTKLTGESDPEQYAEYQAGPLKMHGIRGFGGRLSPIWGRHDGHLVFAVDERAAQAGAQRLSSDTGIESNERFARMRKHLPAVDTPGFFEIFVDGAGIVTSLVEPAIATSGDPELPRRILDAVGVRELHGLAWQLRTEGERAHTSCLLLLGDTKKGVATLWDQAPLTPEDLRLIPDEVYWASACNLDLARFWAEVRRGVESVDASAATQVDGAVAMASQFIGFSLTDDLLPVLGDTWILYDAPRHGGIYGTGTVLINDVRDAEALHGMALRSVEVLNVFLPQIRPESKTPPRIVHREARRGDLTAHYLVVHGLPAPVTPSWGFVGGRVVFGLLPQNVLMAMEQIQESTRGKSLVDRPDVQADLKSMPTEMQTFWCMDNHYFLHTIYPLLTHVGAAFESLNPDANSIDMLRLPHFADALNAPQYSVSTGARVPEGFLSQTRGATAPIASVGAVALVVSILLPSLTRARELARRAVCGSNLRGLAMTCHIYANENDDQFPPDLATLWDHDATTPEMFVCPSAGYSAEEAAELIKSESFDFPYVYITGQTTMADPRNVLIYERLFAHAGDGGNLAFVDGHVEFAKPPRYQELIRETFRRLGREEEIPDEMNE